MAIHKTLGEIIHDNRQKALDEKRADFDKWVEEFKKVITKQIHEGATNAQHAIACYLAHTYDINGQLITIENLNHPLYFQWEVLLRWAASERLAITLKEVSVVSYHVYVSPLQRYKMSSDKRKSDKRMLALMTRMHQTYKRYHYYKLYINCEGGMV